MHNVAVSSHPLIATKLSNLRAAGTGVAEFRRNLQDISILLFIEATRTWATTATEVQTPLESCAGAIFTRPLVLAPILRAGLGMVDGLLRMNPDAAVGHIGLYRDEQTLRPVSYYCRLPQNLGAAEVLLLDPMLATGNSACEALSGLKAQGATQLTFICVVACPAGIKQLHATHPEVPIVTAAIDPGLDARGYIVPGLGDAGDRYFGT